MLVLLNLRILLWNIAFLQHSYAIFDMRVLSLAVDFAVVALNVVDKLIQSTKQLIY